ncbi:Choline dehydrogenase, mitochondrial [Grifola frondosa]|uniref:Choline dehydrogenase, mitochondrial n=1 Tax=Grifola frondosa TaxID=5627 RepID=A0A1C7LYX4_GRIFR|nr:Choline dehydrogenase, mitochondrial [Grifola frondosa]
MVCWPAQAMLTAGLVVASRLTENPNVSVAVLEAGKAHFNDSLVLAPDGWMKQVMNPEYDWVFHLFALTMFRILRTGPFYARILRTLEFSSIPVSFARTSSGVEFSLQKSLGQHGVDTINDAAWSSECYLQPALDHPNLKVFPEAYVTKVLTSTEGPNAEVVAHGVEFEHGGATHQMYAAKESPQILELSGIGDRAILEPLGITVKRHLPTFGANVQDHIILTAFVFEMRAGNKIITSGPIRDPKFQSKLREAYGDVGDALALVMTGLTFLPIQSFCERARRRHSPGAGGAPDGALLHFLTVAVTDHWSRFRQAVCEAAPVHRAPILPRDHPHRVCRSEGAAEIDPNYLAEQIDLEILVDSFKCLRKVTHTDPFKSLSIAELRSGPNTCGSCSILPEGKDGVVDPKLKVYGTENIRVVDLPILSLLTAVHTQAM